jgi:hypothetical protein
MTKDEEIEYWKEKYRVLKLSKQEQQTNYERMTKFKMVYIIEELLTFITFESPSQEVVACQIAVTKSKVNQQLGVEYFTKENKNG